MLSLGPRGLTDAELIAVVLGASNREGGVLGASRELLSRFDGLRGLVRCHPDALMQVPGIGNARACALAAVIELARRLEACGQVRGVEIKTSADAFRILRPRLSLLDHEVFLVLVLDGRHRVMGVRQVAQGGATSVEVHPREVFAPAVRDAGAAIIVGHNHPSGDPEPSLEDRQLTVRLSQAGEIMSIPVLDHLVVGAGVYVSLADRGEL